MRPIAIGLLSSIDTRQDCQLLWGHTGATEESSADKRLDFDSKRCRVPPLNGHERDEDIAEGWNRVFLRLWWSRGLEEGQH